MSLDGPVRTAVASDRSYLIRVYPQSVESTEDFRGYSVATLRTRAANAHRGQHQAKCAYGCCHGRPPMVTGLEPTRDRRIDQIPLIAMPDLDSSSQRARVPVLHAAT